MPGPTFQTEIALAAPVVTWLQEMGWDVFQEVQLERGGRIADVVATKGPKTWIVEVKRQLGFEVLEQALGWDGYAHLISVAVPERPLQHKLVMAELRLGLLHVAAGGRVREIRASTPRRPDLVCHGNLRDALRPEMKTYAPAGSRGQRWTPYQQTAHRLAEYVRDHPGTPFTQVLQEIEHHYATEKSACFALDKLIRKGKVRGVVGRFETNHYRLFPPEVS